MNNGEVNVILKNRFSLLRMLLARDEAENIPVTFLGEIIDAIHEVNTENNSELEQAKAELLKELSVKDIVPLNVDGRLSKLFLLLH